MGRSSECSQEHVDKGIAYINGGYIEQGEIIPTSDGLAIYLDVARATPYNWTTQESCQFKDEFAYIVDRVQAIQGMRVVTGGLDGTFNPSFAGKIASNHGYGDKQTLNHVSEDGSMKPSVIILPPKE